MQIKNRYHCSVIAIESIFSRLANSHKIILSRDNIANLYFLLFIHYLYGF